jgi:predicted CopG family antitoxin
MATKTVALDEEAYQMLKRQKRGEESFSDAVKRLARPRRSIMSFAGIWSDMTEVERRRLDRAYADMHRADRGREEKIRKLWR